MKVSDLDFKRIPAPTIEKLFLKEKIADLSQFSATCHEDLKEPYLYHSKSYFYPEPIDQVWEAYIHPHPCTLWDSDAIQFQMVFDRMSKTVIYRDSSFSKLSVGQIYFVDLKIIKGFHIPVLHEISKVDPSAFTIQTCYLNTGKSEGSQWIKMRPDSKGGTIITHETRYKGTSFIRDRILYPYFHEIAIDQFHGNSKKYLQEKY